MIYRWERFDVVLRRLQSRRDRHPHEARGRISRRHLQLRLNHQKRRAPENVLITQLNWKLQSCFNYRRATCCVHKEWFKTLLNCIVYLLFQICSEHLTKLVSFDGNQVLHSDAEKVCAFLHRVMRFFRREHHQTAGIPFRLAVGEFPIPPQMNSVHVRCTAARTENPFAIFKPEQSQRFSQHFFLYQSETRRHFKCVLASIKCTCYPLSAKAVIIESAEKLIVKVAIVGFDWSLDDFSTQINNLCVIFERLDVIGQGEVYQILFKVTNREKIKPQSFVYTFIT